MTTWVENPREGRQRGPAGLARAWVGVLVRPRAFFRTAVAPGDQAPGLVFAVVVAVGYVASRFLLVPGTIPVIEGGPALSALLALLAVALLVAPATLHLTAALQTVLLVPLVSERAGVSETVQVVAYATAPCLLAGVPNAGLQAVCAAYGLGLLVVGIREVHQTSTGRAALAALLPGVFVFGYAFGGVDAVVALMRAWTLI